jgi:hypothetical protein
VRVGSAAGAGEFGAGAGIGLFEDEKAVRELPFLGFMFEMPIVVAGVGVSGTEVPRNNEKYLTREATE